MDKNLIASVDLGSNSFRLQICRNHNGQLQVIDSIKEMVRLAAGLDDQKKLRADAKLRALMCLSRFGERLRNFSSEKVRAVATNTFRVMNNVDVFLQEAEAALGFPIEIIAGREEARLIYTGVVHTVPFNHKRALVVDIGGGSTEFIIGKDIQPIALESLPLGCVSYTLRFFPNGKISESNFENAINTARNEIQRITDTFKKISWDLAIGSSGTARAIRDIIHSENPLKNNIDLESLLSIKRQMIECAHIKKLNLPELKADRAEVIVGGLSVMIAIFKELEIKEMMVTDAALRDGVFYDLIGRELEQDLRDETINTFQKRYNIDTQQAYRVEQIALNCLSAISSSISEIDKQYWHHFVSWGAKTHEIGLSISYTAYHKHSAYILEQSDMPGFSKTEQQNLSILVLSHRGDLKKVQDYLERPQMATAILSLRLATLLCRARTNAILPENTTLKFNHDKHKIVFGVYDEWLQKNPLTAHALNLEAEAWSKIDWQLQINAIK